MTIQSSNAILTSMGRKRSFDDDEVLARAREVFLEHGYEGTSIDALVKATGLLRGSLYGAFGSKRGMFVAALRDATDSESRDSGVLNLVLVALMELSDHDLEVRRLVRDYLVKLSSSGSDDTNAVTVDVATLLGETLLQRAHIRLQSDDERR
ncbi:TetR/AcrR family transcriptional regulator [Bifidobacterium asteroides]|nr:helix-turn-helix domain-containing protein [Bifidobacterium asteroides]